MDDVDETIGITGSTGYIGAATVKQALARGYRVLLLGRRRPADESSPFAFFDLRENGELDEPLQSCKAIIHLAADTAAGSHADPEVELKATRRLMRAAETAQFVYVSSISASSVSPSGYARSKWLVEQEVRKADGCIVRPGLVYGGTESGLFGELCRLVRRLPVIPAFIPPPKVQPIHVDELASALIDAVDGKWSGTWTLAARAPMSLTRFLRIVASKRVRARRLFLPIPVGVVFAADRVFRWLPGWPDCGRLRSLYATSVIDTSRDLEVTKLALQPVSLLIPAGSAGRRHALLLEARTLLTYVLRAPPRSSVSRRYVRAVEALDNGRPLVLPAWALAFPSLLALLDVPLAKSPNELSWRISWATRIAEASPDTTGRFILSVAKGPLTAVWRVTWAMCVGRFLRILAWSFGARLRSTIHFVEDAA